MASNKAYLLKRIEQIANEVQDGNRIYALQKLYDQQKNLLDAEKRTAVAKLLASANSELVKLTGAKDARFTNWSYNFDTKPESPMGKLDKEFKDKENALGKKYDWQKLRAQIRKAAQEASDKVMLSGGDASVLAEFAELVGKLTKDLPEDTFR